MYHAHSSPRISISSSVPFPPAFSAPLRSCFVLASLLLLLYTLYAQPLKEMEKAAVDVMSRELESATAKMYVEVKEKSSDERRWK